MKSHRLIVAKQSYIGIFEQQLPLRTNRQSTA
jgi:hypothetical protein